MTNCRTYSRCRSAVLARRCYYPYAPIAALLVLTLIHNLVSLRLWPSRTLIGSALLGGPVWLIPTLCFLYIIASSWSTKQGKSGIREVVGCLLRPVIFGVSIYLAWQYGYTAVFTPVNLGQVPYARCAAMLVVMAVAGFLVSIGTRRTGQLFDTARAFSMADTVLLFLVIVNFLLIILPEVQFLSGRAAASEAGVRPITFKIGYSDVGAVESNPLFDLPRLLISDLGLRYFSDTIICMYYGAFAVALSCMVLSVFVGRQAAAAAAFCVASYKPFLIIVFSGTNVVTALLAVSLGLALVSWLARSTVTRWDPLRLMLVASLVGLFSVTLLFCYAASRLPALALLAMAAGCLSLALFRHHYRYLTRVSVLCATVFMPCVFVASVYKLDLSAVKRDFIHSVTPDIDVLLPERPAYVPAEVEGMTPDLTIFIGHTRVSIKHGDGSSELRPVTWRRSPEEILRVAQIHTSRVLENYSGFPGGILIWIFFAAGVAALISSRTSRLSRGALILGLLAFAGLLVMPLFIVTSPGEWRRGASILGLFCCLGGVGLYAMVKLLFPYFGANRTAVITALFFASISARASVESINEMSPYAFGMSPRCSYNPVRTLLKDDVVARSVPVYVAGSERHPCPTSTAEALRRKVGENGAFFLVITKDVTFDQLLSQMPKRAALAINCGEYGGAEYREICHRVVHDPRARLIDQLTDKTNDLWLLETSEEYQDQKDSR